MICIWRGGAFFLFGVIIRADVPYLATRGHQSPSQRLRREAPTTPLIWSSPSTRGGREQKNGTCSSWIIHAFTLGSHFALVCMFHVNTVSQLNGFNLDEHFSEARSATHL